MKQLIVSTDDIISRFSVPSYERFVFMTLEEYSSQHLGREMHDLASIAMARHKSYLADLEVRRVGRYFYYSNDTLGHVTILGVYGDDITARKEFDYQQINPNSLPVLMIAGRLYIPVVPDPVYLQLRRFSDNLRPITGKLPVIGQESMVELAAGEGVEIDKLDWSARCNKVFADDPEHALIDAPDYHLLLDLRPNVILPSDALPDIDEGFEDLSRIMTIAHSQGKTIKELTGYDVKVYLFDRADSSPEENSVVN